MLDEWESWLGAFTGFMWAMYLAGESMFYKRDNASKYCLVYLVEKLKSIGLHLDGHTDGHRESKGLWWQVYSS